MPRIDLTDEDAEHIRDWQRLSSDEKETLTRMAKYLAKEERRRSFYELIEKQVEITNLLIAVSHFGWFGRMFLRAGLIATVFISIATFIKMYFGGK